MAIEPGPSASAQLSDYLGTLRRRKWTILVVIVLAVAAALAFSKSQTPTYQAQATVLLSSPGNAVDSALGITGGPSNVADQIARLESPAVSDSVRRQLGVAPAVSGHNPSGTDLMVVSVTYTDPQIAAKAANAYGTAYIAETQSSAIASYLSAAKVVEGQISSVQRQIADLPTGNQGSANAQLASLQSQLSLLQQEANTLQTDASLGATGAQLLTPATPPSSPSSPKTARNGFLGLGGGLILGIALGFLRESLDDTIVGREDLDRAQPGLPVLGLLPAVSGRESAPTELIALSRPHSYAAEAYRSLRTSVQFLGLDQPLKLLQVTSPRTSEGKTTVAANLAVTLAAAGQRVIIVDCDLRRSRLHQVYKLDNEKGFTSVLMGETPIAAALQPAPGVENLSVLPAGVRPPNPAELLSGARAAEVFSALSRMADVVVVDCPPVLPVTDAALTATNVDATLIVVSSGATSGRDLSHTLEVLGQVDAPVVGAVLNAVPVNAGYRYRYRYTYEPRHATTDVG